ncbi:MAG: GNAT family N-acetyltransferase [Hyphomicrobiaceae bacterium]
MVMKIRVACPADEAPVSALLASCYVALLPAAYPADVLAAALPLMTRANPRLLTSGTCFVAGNSDGALVGCGGWSTETPGTGTIAPDVGHIRHFATAPSTVRQGVGRAIMGRCLDGARRADIPELQCFATLNARRFYEASGFETIGEHTVLLARETPFACLFMRQRLRPKA